MDEKSREMYSSLFEGMAAETVKVGLSNEVLEQVRRLAEENGWAEEEALRIILANGLFYLLGEQRLAELNLRDSELGVEVTRLTAELMDAQSKYAVMKFRAFTLQQDNQALEFQNTALRVENGMAMSRLDKFREDEELLRAELRRLQNENEQLRRRASALAEPAEAPSSRPSLVRRLLPWARK
jgi:hypothetical protein